MKQSKKLSSVFTSFLGLCCLISATSCQNDETVDAPKESPMDAKEFNENLRSNLDYFMKTPISGKSYTDNLTRVNDLSNSYLYTDTSFDVIQNENNDNDNNGSSNNNDSDHLTPQQLFEFVLETGAELKPFKDEEHQDSIAVSEEEIVNALNPLISDSKSYLYSKGLSEADIQEMLIENSVDESTLIPFVLVLTEEEMNQSTIELDENDIKQLTRSDIDWELAKHCALEALGVDIIFNLRSVGSAWTKAALKKSF